MAYPILGKKEKDIFSLLKILVSSTLSLFKFVVWFKLLKSLIPIEKLPPKYYAPFSILSLSFVSSCALLIATTNKHR